jgi:hypothetical protein
LNAFLTFAKNTPRRFRFVLTSRNDAKFEKIFTAFEHAPLVHAHCLDTSATVDDIRRFAAAELRTAMAGGADDLEAACDEMAHAVQGSFLLARMLVADLRAHHASGGGGDSGGGGGDRSSGAADGGPCTGRDVSAFLASYFLRLQTRADGRDAKHEVRTRPLVHVPVPETVAADDSPIAVDNAG